MNDPCDCDECRQCRKRLRREHRQEEKAKLKAKRLAQRIARKARHRGVGHPDSLEEFRRANRDLERKLRGN